LRKKSKVREIILSKWFNYFKKLIKVEELPDGAVQHGAEAIPKIYKHNICMNHVSISSNIISYQNVKINFTRTFLTFIS
jgi:hypothetical protein